MQLADPIPAPATPVPPATPASADAQAASPLSTSTPPAPGTDPAHPLAHGTAHDGGDPLHPGGTMRLPIHVNARGLALGIIATIAFVYALQWSEKFLVPLLLGIFIAYTLNPVVIFLERCRIKRVFGATLVTVAILVLMAGVVHRVQGEIFNIIEWGFRFLGRV